MASTIRRIDYFYITVKDQPGEAYKLLSSLEELGVNLLAFSAVPIGPNNTQLSVFPEDTLKLENEAARAGVELDGPHPALIVQGDDELGVLAAIHLKLYEVHVNVYASYGVTDGRGSFGYVIYVKPEDYESAADALDV